MTTYYKLVAVNSKQSEWMFKEFLEGRVHFGWSGPGNDLHILKNMHPSKMTPEQKTSWRYSQFLLRVNQGDRLIIQLEQPLRKFLIAEVVGGYSFQKPEQSDFNHILACNPLTSDFINTSSSVISYSLVHDLTKRGQYYQIYSNQSKQELDRIVEQIEKQGLAFYMSSEYKAERTEISEMQKIRNLIIKDSLKTIARGWKSKDFEKFTARLINNLPSVKVDQPGDRGKGWDMTISIEDPLTAEITDGIPVQCKNYTGDVINMRPIDDLVRSIRSSGKDKAYLFILGNLTADFQTKVKIRQEELANELGRPVEFLIVDQERIMDLYLKYLIHEI